MVETTPDLPRHAGHLAKPASATVASGADIAEFLRYDTITDIIKLEPATAASRPPRHPKLALI
jgi:hypothetical protein